MKQLYLLGWPVDHSVSPSMHNAAFKELGLDFEYKLKAVKPCELSDAVDGLRDPQIRGANVTIPHKVTAMSLVDQLDISAKAAGAVNTIINDDGRLTGYNTDGDAASRVLQESYGNLRGAKVVILGAGGAAKSIASSILKEGVEITVLNRNVKKARDLIEDCGKWGGLEDAARILPSTDILINATPIGMSPNLEFTPINPRLLHEGLFVFDLVYNPEKTRLLRDAEAVGARTQGGLQMLVYQGAAAFSLWTRIRPSEMVMLNAARWALTGV